MTGIDVRPVEYAEVRALRELYRADANVQIVRDSALGRGFAQAYLLRLDGELAGYGSVGTRYNTGHVLEFYTHPGCRGQALALFERMLAVSEATHIQAQTNMPLMLMLLEHCADPGTLTTEAILFEDSFVSRLTCPGAIFRRVAADDRPAIFPHTHEPVGEWVIETDGAIVATGGFLTHCNPPYADLFMEVSPDARRRGYGSFLVQELKRVCCETGQKPAARCDPENIASRQTLQKAGFAPCGRLLLGEVRPARR